MQKTFVSGVIALLLGMPTGSAADRVPVIDRTTCVIPQNPGGPPPLPPAGQFPDEAFGESASGGWRAYLRVWKAHHRDPGNEAIRRFLGLPLSPAGEAQPRRGRSAPRWLPWRLGDYLQIDTPHLTVFSHADADATREVATDLERCYWIWTQMFFPLWEGGAQVETLLRGVDENVDIVAYLESQASRITVRRKLRVVLFRDANEYRQTLGAFVPGVERSTGYYSDDRETIFLYVGQGYDVATRRHEMVHQLFREATRSSLGRERPGEQTNFWLIEGIAGYFESLRISGGLATVGGWDAPRLQFARYRMLVGGDTMPFDELAADGRQAAQQRPDIARWYAHAITQTHHLLDRGDVSSRRWIYHQLARMYKIKDGPAAVDQPLDLDRGLKPFLVVDDVHLRHNKIEHALKQLCLAGCEVSPKGLATIPEMTDLQWLDLSRLPVDTEDLRRLVPVPTSLQQLSLEATRIDPSVATWLAAAHSLQELDLSWTQIGDETLQAIAAGKNLEVLWLTGTQVTDHSIDKIGSLAGLQSVDLQRTQVTQSGLDRLKQLRPDLEIDPLQLRSP